MRTEDIGNLEQLLTESLHSDKYHWKTKVFAGKSHSDKILLTLLSYGMYK